MQLRLNKTYRLLLIIVILIIPVLGSSQDPETRKIDSLKNIVENPKSTYKDLIYSYHSLVFTFFSISKDSAFHYADKGINHFKKKKNKKGITRLLLLRGRALGAFNEIEKGIKYFEESYSYYDELEEDSHFLLICEELGNYHDLLSNFYSAITYYNKGLESSVEQESKLYEAYFSRHLSNIYSKIDQQEIALKYIQNAIVLFADIEIMNQHAYSLIKLAHIYYLKGLNELAIEKLNEAEKYILSDKRIVFPHALMNIYLIRGQIEYRLGNYDLAIKLLLRSKDYAFQANEFDENVNVLIGFMHNYLGLSYLESGELYKAITEFQSAKTIGDELYSLELLEFAYDGLYNGYLTLKNIDSVTFYHKKHKPILDSLNKEKFNRQIDQLQFDNQLTLEKEKHQNELEVADLSKKRQRLYFGVISLLLILSLIVISFFGFAQKNRALKAKIKNKNLSLEKENLSLKLDKKERELTASVLNLVERNEFISRLTDDLKSISFNDEQATQIKEIIKATTINDSKKLWTEFELRYTQNNTTLFNKLYDLAPNLTANDKRLIALIMLNFSTKEISSITYQSPHSIKIARYRLRKKLDINKNENLVQFFNNL